MSTQKHITFAIVAVLPTTLAPFVGALEIPGMWVRFVDSILRGDGTPNRMDTLKQRWNQATTDGFCGRHDKTGLSEALCESHSHGVDIWRLS